jgi:hypothetical protein
MIEQVRAIWQSLIELTARVQALEDAENLRQQDVEAEIVDYYAALSAQHQGRAVFHDNSKPTLKGPLLVTRVAAAISEDGKLINWPGAYAAIREVAAWLREEGYPSSPARLEQEAER